MKPVKNEPRGEREAKEKNEGKERKKRIKKKKEKEFSELSQEERRERRRRQRKNNKRKRILRIFLFFVLVIGLIGGLSSASYLAIKGGFFNIVEIQVIGNEIIDTQSVIDVSEIKQGESIFLVDLNKAHYKINALVNLDKLEILKIMPNKIHINMKESKPLCAINFNEKMIYITKEGSLIENGEYLRKTDIPVVFGVSNITTTEIGKKVVVEPYWRFENVMNILKDLDDHENLSKISEVRMTENNTYEVVSKNGTILIVYDYNNFLENGNYIQNVLDQNTSNMIINLTGGTRPVVKPR